MKSQPIKLLTMGIAKNIQIYKLLKESKIDFKFLHLKYIGLKKVKLFKSNESFIKNIDFLIARARARRNVPVMAELSTRQTMESRRESFLVDHRISCSRKRNARLLNNETSARKGTHF